MNFINNWIDTLLKDLEVKRAEAEKNTDNNSGMFENRIREKFNKRFSEDVLRNCYFSTIEKRKIKEQRAGDKHIMTSYYTSNSKSSIIKALIKSKNEKNRL